MGLYMPEGWLNFDYIAEQPEPIQVILGGRGTGKTFGGFTWLLQHRTEFLLMRTTKEQIDLIKQDAFSPINKAAEALHLPITTKSINKYCGAFYNGDEPAPIGYAAGLSTFGNIRGFDASSVKVVLFDEFIPEKTARKMKYEGYALRNAYETINRNRELEGEPPLKMWLLSNAESLDSGILLDFGLVDKIHEMSATGGVEWHDPAGKMAVYMLSDSPISAKKASTFLYQVGGNSRYNKMALNNQFSTDYGRTVAKMQVREYKLICQMGEGLFLYTHKSLPLWFISRKRHGSTSKIFDDTVQDRELWRQEWGALVYPYRRGAILFDAVSTEIEFVKVWLQLAQ